MTGAPELRPVLDGLHLPECPRWHDGALWLADIWGHEVLRVGEDGAAEVVHAFPDDEGPAGLGWLPDGRLLVVGMYGRVVYRVEGGSASVHADLRHLSPYPLNDMIVAADGTAYVSGFGWDVWGGGTYADNALLRVHPDGRAGTVADGMMAPNGMALTDDGRVLVVAEPGGGRLSRFTVTADGGLTDRRLVPLPKAAGADHVTPDGICLDATGAVWAADPMGRRVIRVLPDGTVTHAVPVSPGYPLACVLGGADRRTLFIAIGAATRPQDRPAEPGGRLVALAADVPGAGRP
ncbi:MAG TPA: SMP-30/gluconolactonase/LRE family protein [Acidimicrobiales bacterium]|nr:SMP-30/gluconolactonase/LRE family protein [Acidimicrobiales bacterium]